MCVARETDTAIGNGELESHTGQIIKKRQFCSRKNQSVIDGAIPWPCHLRIPGAAAVWQGRRLAGKQDRTSQNFSQKMVPVERLTFSSGEAVCWIFSPGAVRGSRVLLGEWRQCRCQLQVAGVTAWLCAGQRSRGWGECIPLRSLWWFQVSPHCWEKRRTESTV